MKTLRNLVNRQNMFPLIIASTIAIIVGSLQIGEPIEDVLRVAKGKLLQTPMTGNIVLVGIDNASTAQIGRWPWPRAVQAKLIKQVHEANPKAIILDFTYDTYTNTMDDEALSSTLNRVKSENAALYQYVKFNVKNTNITSVELPKPEFQTKLVNGLVRYNAFGNVTNIDRNRSFNGVDIPSISEIASGRIPQTTDVQISTSLDMDTMPIISAEKVLRGAFSKRSIEGKTIIIGLNSVDIADAHYVLGYGRIPGSQKVILSSETLLQGKQISLGWFPAFIILLIVAGFTNKWVNYRRYYVFVAATMAIIIFSFILSPLLIFTELVPALAFAVLVGANMIITGATRSATKRGMTTNPVTGLPNFHVIRNYKRPPYAIVMVRLTVNGERFNHLTESDQKALTSEMVSIIQRTTGSQHVYHSDQDDFLFPVVAGNTDLFTSQFEDLKVQLETIKTTATAINAIGATFGIDMDMHQDLSDRAAAASTALERAESRALFMKVSDASMSLIASARASAPPHRMGSIRKDVNTLFFPVVQLPTNKVAGTYLFNNKFRPISVGDDAHENIIAFLSLLKQGLSAQQSSRSGTRPSRTWISITQSVLTNSSLTDKIVQTLMDCSVTPCDLTIIVDNQTDLIENDRNLRAVKTLRAAGLGIAIHEYGLADWTYEQIRRVPATEIHLSERLLSANSLISKSVLRSTYQLAHQLGRELCLFNIDDAALLDYCRDLDRIYVSGPAVSRPVSIQQLGALYERQK